RPSPKSLKESEQEKTSLRKSFSALVFIPRFFREIWRSNKKSFLLSAFCRLIGAVLPVIILWVGKLIIDEIILQTQLEVSDLTQLWTYVGLELGLIVLSDLMSRAISLTDG